MSKHRVVILGSGFGGLFAAQQMKRDKDIEITLIARTTSHLFQPLLYQVATGIMSEGEVAPPTREILKKQKNVEVLQGLVTDVDVERKIVHWRFHDAQYETEYDSLIVALGAGGSYFGNDHFAKFAPGLKTIDDALELRARIFNAFEMAEFAQTEEERRKLLTFVVVGAGPTGVEMAGQIRELASETLKEEFRNFDPASARVLLVDGADQVLPPFGPSLGKKAKRKLQKLGVEVRLNTMVTDVTADDVEFKDKDGATERIPTSCKVWAAGVQGNPLGESLANQTGAELDRSKRVQVEKDLTLPGHPEIFVVGDMMALDGVPGVAQGAIQSGQHAAKTIQARVNGQEEPGDFNYWDKGSMAVISKYSAVVKTGKLEITGFFAWLAWLGLHLFYITGFKERFMTLINWFLSFITDDRSQRAATNQQMVGRLAMERLGSNTSGKLYRDEEKLHDEPDLDAAKQEAEQAKAPEAAQAN